MNIMNTIIAKISFQEFIGFLSKDIMERIKPTKEISANIIEVSSLLNIVNPLRIAWIRRITIGNNTRIKERFSKDLDIIIVLFSYL